MITLVQFGKNQGCIFFAKIYLFVHAKGQMFKVCLLMVAILDLGSAQMYTLCTKLYTEPN